MITEILNPQTTEIISLAGIAMLGYFTHRQKEWILKVWGNRCQGANIGMKHQCRDDLQIHHVIPQLWGYEKLGMNEEEVDSPYNAIPLCSDAHLGTRGTKDCIHTDQQDAVTSYRIEHNQHAFGQLQDRRKMMMNSGLKYWSDKWDTNMTNLVMAKINKHFKEKKEPFPIHEHNGKT